MIYDIFSEKLPVCMELYSACISFVVMSHVL